MKKLLRWVGVVCAGIGDAIILLFGYAVWVSRKIGPQSSSQEIAEQKRQTGSGRLSVGERGTLRSMALASKTKDGSDEVFRAIRAKDNVGLAQMVMRGDAATVQPGDRVLVIDNSFTLVRVRIESGKSEGADGWLPFELVQ